MACYARASTQLPSQVFDYTIGLQVVTSLHDMTKRRV